MFGPNQDPTGFPSETPIEAVKKKHVMLNNDCHVKQYVNIIIKKLKKTFRPLTFQPDNHLLKSRVPDPHSFS